MEENRSKDVWVFIEQRGGKPAEVSLELLCKGKKLAQSLQGNLTSVAIGANAVELARATFNFGADEALVVQHPSLRDYRTQPYSRVLCELVQQHSPRILLFGATVIGRDLAPRVASHTRSGLTADCTDLRIADVEYQKTAYRDLLLQIRPAFGGNIIATIISPDSPTQMATVREGVMECCPQASAVPGSITEIPYQEQELDNVVELLEQHREERRVNLKAAPIIVSGGYGLGSRDGFQLVHDLARTLGAEVAGSRAAVDAGFISPERQVGQTGVTVRPKLYVAVGISGAIQHRAGMQDSSKIIAINTDPDAPIFQISHHAIVGDANEVIPQLIEVYKLCLK